MLTKIQLAVLILSLMDLTASFFYISTFNKLHPELDPTIIEANPILKFAIKTFGIGKGMLFGGALLFLTIIIFILPREEKFLYFAAGLLSMMNIYHWLNFRLLKIT